MRFAALLLIPVLVTGQSDPPYDPNDPEGLVYHPNGRTRMAWKRQGQWIGKTLAAPWPAAGIPAVAPGDLAKMAATMDAVTAILRATKEGGDPRGYYMEEGRNAYYQPPHEVPPGVTLATLPIQFTVGYFPHYIYDSLRDGKWVWDKSGETTSVYLWFNRLPGRVSQNVLLKEPGRAADAPIEIFTRPDDSRLYRGFPFLDGQDLLIARAGRDPYAPVSYARALKLAITEFEKDRKTAENRLADLKKKAAETLSPEYEKAMRDHLEKYSGQFRTTDPKKWEGRVAGMERELKYNREKAAKDADPQRDKDGAWYWNPVDAHEDAKRRLASLTAAEGAKPACYLEAKGEQGRYAMRGAILTVGADPACRPLVTNNYDYFDPKLPRTAPQILVIQTFGRCVKWDGAKWAGPPKAPPSYFPPQGCYRLFPIYEEMDWKKLAGLLVP